MLQKLGAQEKEIFTHCDHFHSNRKDQMLLRHKDKDNTSIALKSITAYMHAAVCKQSSQFFGHITLHKFLIKVPQVLTNKGCRNKKNLKVLMESSFSPLSKCWTVARKNTLYFALQGSARSEMYAMICLGTRTSPAHASVAY